MIHACSFILWPAGVIFNAGVTVSVKEQYQAVCFLVFWVQRHPNPINSQLLPGCFCFRIFSRASEGFLILMENIFLDPFF
jgi:hypothetical protein